MTRRRRREWGWTAAAVLALPLAAIGLIPLGIACALQAPFNFAAERLRSIEEGNHGR